MVIATPGDADVLLPPVAHNQTASHVIERLFPKLADLTLALNTVDDSGFAPVLAERWERRDSLTIAFTLEARARWQDGVPITADDVVFSLDVYRDTLAASPYAPSLEPVAEITAENARTAVVRFRRVYPEQLYDVAYHLYVMPKHLLDSVPRARLASSTFARAPVGAGPWRFVRWTPGAEIVVEADTTWFRGRPNLDRLVWRVLPDVSTAVTALLGGEADALEVVLQRDDLERVAGAPALRLVPYASPLMAGILFNVRRPPWNDRALRRAVAMAVDRETIVRNLFGPYGEVPIGSTSRMQWIAGAPARQLPFDTLAARAALDALGWRDANGDGVRERGGRPLRLALLVPTTSRARQQAAQLVQDQLRRVGVELRIQPLEFGVFDRRTAAGDFEAMFFSWTLDPSPVYLAHWWRSGAPDNRGGYASPAFDSLFAEAAAATTRTEALPRWQRVLEQLNDDAPGVFIYSPRNHAAVARRLDGVTIRPDSWLAMVASWRLAADARP